jgi:heme oxygenase
MMRTSGDRQDETESSGDATRGSCRNDVTTRRHKDGRNLMQFGSRRGDLRELTASAHALLDATVGPLDTRAAYRRYLLGLDGFRGAAERWLARALLPDAFADWQPTRIADHLAADLGDLGVAARPGAAFDLDQTPSAAAGVAYVLEGSALGGRIIERQALSLGFDARNGARHLAAQGATPVNWRGFLDRLERAEPFDLTAAVAAATTAFRAATDAFESLDHVPA